MLSQLSSLGVLSVVLPGLPLSFDTLLAWSLGLVSNESVSYKPVRSIHYRNAYLYLQDTSHQYKTYLGSGNAAELARWDNDDKLDNTPWHGRSPFVQGDSLTRASPERTLSAEAGEGSVSRRSPDEVRLRLTDSGETSKHHKPVFGACVENESDSMPLEGPMFCGYLDSDNDTSPIQSCAQTPPRELKPCDDIALSVAISDEHTEEVEPEPEDPLSPENVKSQDSLDIGYCSADEQARHLESLSAVSIPSRVPEAEEYDTCEGDEDMDPDRLIDEEIKRNSEAEQKRKDEEEMVDIACISMLAPVAAFALETVNALQRLDEGEAQVASQEFDVLQLSTGAESLSGGDIKPGIMDQVNNETDTSQQPAEVSECVAVPSVCDIVCSAPPTSEPTVETKQNVFENISQEDVYRETPSVDELQDGASPQLTSESTLEQDPQSSGHQADTGECTFEAVVIPPTPPPKKKKRKNKKNKHVPPSDLSSPDEPPVKPPRVSQPVAAAVVDSPVADLVTPPETPEADTAPQEFETVKEEGKKAKTSQEVVIEPSAAVKDTDDVTVVPTCTDASLEPHQEQEAIPQEQEVVSSIPFNDSISDDVPQVDTQPVMEFMPPLKNLVDFLPDMVDDDVKAQDAVPDTEEGAPTDKEAVAAADQSILEPESVSVKSTEEIRPQERDHTTNSVEGLEIKPTKPVEEEKQVLVNFTDESGPSSLEYLQQDIPSSLQHAPALKVLASEAIPLCHNKPSQEESHLIQLPVELSAAVMEQNTQPITESSNVQSNIVKEVPEESQPCEIAGAAEQRSPVEECLLEDIPTSISYAPSMRVLSDVPVTTDGQIGISEADKVKPENQVQPIDREESVPTEQIKIATVDETTGCTAREDLPGAVVHTQAMSALSSVPVSCSSLTPQPEVCPSADTPVSAATENTKSQPDPSPMEVYVVKTESTYVSELKPTTTSEPLLSTTEVALIEGVPSCVQYSAALRLLDDGALSSIVSESNLESPKAEPSPVPESPSTDRVEEVLAGTMSTTIKVEPSTLERQTSLTEYSNKEYRSRPILNRAPSTERVLETIEATPPNTIQVKVEEPNSQFVPELASLDDFLPDMTDVDAAEGMADVDGQGSAAEPFQAEEVQIQFVPDLESLDDFLPDMTDVDAQEKTDKCLSTDLEEPTIVADAHTQAMSAPMVAQEEDQTHFVPDLKSIDDFLPDMTDDDVQEKSVLMESEDPSMSETSESPEKAEGAQQSLVTDLESLRDFIPDMTDDEVQCENAEKQDIVENEMDAKPAEETQKPFVPELGKLDKTYDDTEEKSVEVETEDPNVRVSIQVTVHSEPESEPDKPDQLEEPQQPFDIPEPESPKDVVCEEKSKPEKENTSTSTPKVYEARLGTSVQFVPDLDSLDDFLPDMTDDDVHEKSIDEHDVKTDEPLVESTPPSMSVHLVPELEDLDDFMPDMTDDDVLEEITEEDKMEKDEPLVVLSSETHVNPEETKVQFVPELKDLDDFMPDMTDDDVLEETPEYKMEKDEPLVVISSETHVKSEPPSKPEVTKVQFVAELEDLDDFMPDMTDDDAQEETTEEHKIEKQEPLVTVSAETVVMSAPFGKAEESQSQLVPEIESLDDSLPDVTNECVQPEESEEVTETQSVQFVPDLESLDDFMPDMTDDDVVSEHQKDEHIISEEPMMSVQETQMQFVPELDSLDDFIPDMTDDDVQSDKWQTEPNKVEESVDLATVVSLTPKDTSVQFVPELESLEAFLPVMTDDDVQPAEESRESRLENKVVSDVAETPVQFVPNLDSLDDFLPDMTDDDVQDSKTQDLEEETSNSESSPEGIESKLETTLQFVPELDSLDDFLPDMTDDDVQEKNTIEFDWEKDEPQETASVDTLVESAPKSKQEDTQVQFVPELDSLDDFMPDMTDDDAKEDTTEKQTMEKDEQLVTISSETLVNAAPQSKPEETQVQFVPDLESLDDFMPDMTDDDVQMEGNNEMSQSDIPAPCKESSLSDDALKQFIPELESLDDLLPDMTDDDVIPQEARFDEGHHDKATEVPEAELADSSSPDGNDSPFMLDEDTDERPLSQCEQLETDTISKMSVPMVLSWADDVSDSSETQLQPLEVEAASVQSQESDRPQDSTPSVSEEDSPKKKKRNRKNRNKRLPEPAVDTDNKTSSGKSAKQQSPVDETQTVTPCADVKEPIADMIDPLESIDNVEETDSAPVESQEEAKTLSEAKRPGSLPVQNSQVSQASDLQQEPDIVTPTTPGGTKITYAQVVAKDQPNVPVIEQQGPEPTEPVIEFTVEEPWQCIYPMEEDQTEQPFIPVGAAPKKKRKRKKRKSQCEDDHAGTDRQLDVEIPTYEQEESPLEKPLDDSVPAAQLEYETSVTPIQQVTTVDESNIVDIDIAQGEVPESESTAIDSNKPDIPVETEEPAVVDDITPEVPVEAEEPAVLDLETPEPQLHQKEQMHEPQLDLGEEAKQQSEQRGLTLSESKGETQEPPPEPTEDKESQLEPVEEITPDTVVQSVDHTDNVVAEQVPYETLIDKYAGIQHTPEEEEYMYNLDEDSEDNQDMNSEESDKDEEDEGKMSDSRNSVERGTQTGDGLGRLRRRRRKRLKKRAALLAMKMAARERGEKVEMPAHGSHRRKRRAKGGYEQCENVPVSSSPSTLTTRGVQMVDKSTITPDREISSTAQTTTGVIKSTSDQPPTGGDSAATDKSPARLHSNAASTSESISMSSSITSVPDSNNSDSVTTKKESDADALLISRQKRKKNKKARRQETDSVSESDLKPEVTQRPPTIPVAHYQMSTESSVKESDSEQGDYKVFAKSSQSGRDNIPTPVQETDNQETLRDVLHRIDHDAPTDDASANNAAELENECMHEGAESQDNQRFLDLGDDPQPLKKSDGEIPFGEPESMEKSPLMKQEAPPTEVVASSVPSPPQSDSHTPIAEAHGVSAKQQRRKNKKARKRAVEKEERHRDKDECGDKPLEADVEEPSNQSFLDLGHEPKPPDKDGNVSNNIDPVTPTDTSFHGEENCQDAGVDKDSSSDLPDVTGKLKRRREKKKRKREAEKICRLSGNVQEIQIDEVALETTMSDRETDQISDVENIHSPVIESCQFVQPDTTAPASSLITEPEVSIREGNQEAVCSRVDKETVSVSVNIELGEEQSDCDPKCVEGSTDPPVAEETFATEAQADVPTAYPEIVEELKPECANDDTGETESSDAISNKQKRRRLKKQRKREQEKAARTVSKMFIPPYEETTEDEPKTDDSLLLDSDIGDEILVPPKTVVPQDVIQREETLELPAEVLQKPAVADDNDPQVSIEPAVVYDTKPELMTEVTEGLEEPTAGDSIKSEVPIESEGLEVTPALCDIKPEIPVEIDELKEPIAVDGIKPCEIEGVADPADVDSIIPDIPVETEEPPVVDDIKPEVPVDTEVVEEQAAVEEIKPDVLLETEGLDESIKADQIVETREPALVDDLNQEIPVETDELEEPPAVGSIIPDIPVEAVEMEDPVAVEGIIPVKTEEMKKLDDLDDVKPEVPIETIGLEDPPPVDSNKSDVPESEKPHVVDDIKPEVPIETVELEDPPAVDTIKPDIPEARDIRDDIKSEVSEENEVVEDQAAADDDFAPLETEQIAESAPRDSVKSEVSEAKILEEPTAVDSNKQDEPVETEEPAVVDDITPDIPVETVELQEPPTVDSVRPDVPEVRQPAVRDDIKSEIPADTEVVEDRAAEDGDFTPEETEEIEESAPQDHIKSEESIEAQGLEELTAVDTNKPDVPVETEEPAVVDDIKPEVPVDLEVVRESAILDQIKPDVPVEAEETEIPAAVNKIIPDVPEETEGIERPAAVDNTSLAVQPEPDISTKDNELDVQPQLPLTYSMVASKGKPDKKKKLAAELEAPYQCAVTEIGLPKRRKKKKKGLHQKLAEELDRINANYALENKDVETDAPVVKKGKVEGLGEVQSNTSEEKPVTSDSHGVTIGETVYKSAKEASPPVVEEPGLKRSEETALISDPVHDSVDTREEKGADNVEKLPPDDLATESVLDISETSQKGCISLSQHEIQPDLQPEVYSEVPPELKSGEQAQITEPIPEVMEVCPPPLAWEDVVRHYTQDLPTILYHILGVNTLVSIETGCLPLAPIPEEVKVVEERPVQSSVSVVEQTRSCSPPNMSWSQPQTMPVTEESQEEVPQSVPHLFHQPLAVAVAESVLSDLDDDDNDDDSVVEAPPQRSAKEPLAVSLEGEELEALATYSAVTLLSPVEQTQTGSPITPPDPVWPDQIIPVHQQQVHHAPPPPQPNKQDSLEDEVFIEDSQPTAVPRHQAAKQKAIPTIAITPSDPLPADHFDRFPYSQLISEMKIIDLEYVVETENIEIVECYKDEVEQGDMGGGLVSEQTEQPSQRESTESPEKRPVSDTAEHAEKPEVPEQALPDVPQPELSKSAIEEIAQELRACETSQTMTRSQDFTTTESSDIEVLSEADSLEELPSDTSTPDLTHVGASDSGDIWVVPRDAQSPVFAMVTGAVVAATTTDEHAQSDSQEGSLPADSIPAIMGTSDMSVDSLTADTDSMVQSGHSDFETIDVTAVEVTGAACPGGQGLPSIAEASPYTQMPDAMSTIADPEPAKHQGNQVNPASGDHNHPTHRRTGTPETPDDQQASQPVDPSTLPLPEVEQADDFDNTDHEVLGLMEEGARAVADPWAIEFDVDKDADRSKDSISADSPSADKDQSDTQSTVTSGKVDGTRSRKRKDRDSPKTRKRKVDDSLMSDDSLDDSCVAGGGDDKVLDMKTRPIAVSRRRRTFQDRSFSEDSLDDGSKEVEGIMQGFSSLDHAPADTEGPEDVDTTPKLVEEEGMALIEPECTSPFQQSGIDFLVASHQPQLEEGEEWPTVKQTTPKHSTSSEEELPPPISITRKAEGASDADAAIPMVVITTDVSPLPPAVVEMVIAGVRPPKDLIEPYLQKFEEEERKKQQKMFDQAFTAAHGEPEPQPPPTEVESSAFSVIKPLSAKRLHGKVSTTRHVEDSSHVKSDLPEKASEESGGQAIETPTTSVQQPVVVKPEVVKPDVPLHPSLHVGSDATKEEITEQEPVMVSTASDKIHLDYTDCALPRIHTDEVLAVHKVNLDEYNDYVDALVSEETDDNQVVPHDQQSYVLPTEPFSLEGAAEVPDLPPEQMEKETQWLEEIREATIACKEKVAYKAPKQSKTPEFDPVVFNAWAFNQGNESRADWPGNFPNIKVAREENLNAEIASDRPDEEYTRLVSPELDPSRNENLMELYYGVESNEEEMVEQHEHELPDAETIHTSDMVDPSDSVQSSLPDIRYAPPISQPSVPPDSPPHSPVVTGKPPIQKRSQLTRQPSKDSIDSVELAAARDQIFQMATGIQALDGSSKMYSKEREEHFLSDDCLDHEDTNNNLPTGGASDPRDTQSPPGEQGTTLKPRVEGRSAKRRRNKRQKAKEAAKSSAPSETSAPSVDVNKNSTDETCTTEPVVVKKVPPPIPPKPKLKPKGKKGLLKKPGAKVKSGTSGKRVRFEDGDTETSSDDSDTYIVDEVGVDDYSDLEDFAEYDLTTETFTEVTTSL